VLAVSATQIWAKFVSKESALSTIALMFNIVLPTQLAIIWLTAQFALAIQVTTFSILFYLSIQDSLTFEKAEIASLLD
jgi:hypothetical protein